MITTTLQALDEILSQSPTEIASRRTTAFDELAGDPNRPIVLYGAGGLGRIALKGLRALGRPPVAFADLKAIDGGGSINGIPVLTPAVAAKDFGTDALFVVSIWNAQTEHRYGVTRNALNQLGARHVAPVLALFWKFPETFLPYYCMDVPERTVAAKVQIRQLLKEVADDASRDIVVRQMRWRVQMDFDALPLPVNGPAYFQEDLLPSRGDEVFVDCGAYDGDSLRMFRPRMEGTEARAIAIEPDPDSYARLESYVSAQPSAIRDRVRTIRAALGESPGKLTFDGSGTTSARVSAQGRLEVDCIPLDEVLANETPTFIKMDLEGAELDALRGGEASIRRAQPSMAVCVYHQPDHLWTIPLLLRQMLPKHALHLRPHGYEGWDLVCYAVDRTD